MAKAGNTTQASERRILRKYLARYYRAKDKREILQRSEERRVGNECRL